MRLSRTTCTAGTQASELVDGFDERFRKVSFYEAHVPTRSDRAGWYRNERFALFASGTEEFEPTPTILTTCTLGNQPLHLAPPDYMSSPTRRHADTCNVNRFEYLLFG
jgi:hypothetical protein